VWASTPCPCRQIAARLHRRAEGDRLPIVFAAFVRLVRDGVPVQLAADLASGRVPVVEA
jgi:hypothetical protein